MTLVSVVVPVHNMSKYIHSRVQHLLRQTLQDIEVILIDDGSTDTSASLCRMEATNDRRVKVFSQQRLGYGVARNLGIREACGKYLYFYDLHDTIPPNALEIMFQTAEKSGADLIVSGYELYRDKKRVHSVPRADRVHLSGNVIRNDYTRHIGTYSPLGFQEFAWGKLFRQRFLLDYDIQFPEYLHDQDTVFMVRCISKIKSVYLISDLLYNRRLPSIAKHWSDFPVGFSTISRECNNEITDTIMGWNPNNSGLRFHLQRDYYEKVYLALLDLFDPLLQINPFRRYQMMKSLVHAYLSDPMQKGSAIASIGYRYMTNQNFIRLYLHLRDKVRNPSY